MGDGSGERGELEDGAAVEARLTLALECTGLNLEPAEEAAVRRQLAGSRARAAALRRVPLANGDEPEIVFVPFRADGGEEDR